MFSIRTEAKTAYDAVDGSHPTASQCAKVQCHLMDCECLFLAMSGPDNP